MPPKRKRPRRRAPTPPSENDEYKQKIKDIVNTLEECHDDKIKSLGTLIMYIFNTTDESHGISKKVTDGIQKLRPISETNKELSKSNLKNTNELIERLKTINGSIQTLQQTVGDETTPDGLTDSYKQVVKAIVEYAGKIKCPEKKSFDPKPFDKIITSLKKLDNEYQKHQFEYGKKLTCDELGLRSNSNQKRNTWNNADNEGKIKRCKISLRDIKNSKAFKNFKKVYDTHIYSKDRFTLSRNIDDLKKYLSDLHTPYNKVFSYTGGLIHQLNKIKTFEIMKLDRQRSKQGGSKHHKTKKTKKRIKGKQTRRNKAKNKTTIKAKNKTTIKAKNKTKKR